MNAQSAQRTPEALPLAAAWALFACTASLVLYLSGVTAPVHAWLVGHSNPVWLWAASFVHIDHWHLLTNLAGVLLVNLAFGRLITPLAWLFALAVAAPLAHFIVIESSRFIWVAGLSTALHALVAWVAVSLIVAHSSNGRADYASQLRTPRAFGLLIAFGLVIKVALDALQITRWPEVQAQTAASLHALAALAAVVGVLVGKALGDSIPVWRARILPPRTIV